ncbi:MAG: hypothetical protein KIG53_02690 [Oscillospiraceae bacterium]|nr:hypothetical protein [Oscillospiraceae bacterium]
MIFGVQWYLWLILLVAIILTVFVSIKASKASKIRRERLKKEAELWQRDYDLRQNFSVLTEKKLSETERAELLHGVAMNIQVFLEKESNMNNSFKALPVEKQYIYALEYFDQDAKTGLKTFFKNNGAPLTTVISNALKAVGANKLFECVERIAPMYDIESDVSIDYAIVDKVNEEFKEIYNSYDFCLLCGKYIMENKEIFLS